MSAKKKGKKKLSARDFAGEGEPYTEVHVKISIRILGREITRSRLAVNVYPDPALQQLAKESLKEMGVASYGLNQDGVFGACLSEHFNGWADMDEAYPMIKENGLDEFRRHDAQVMNEYIRKSVDWAMKLHERGMAEAAFNDVEPDANQPVQ